MECCNCKAAVVVVLLIAEMITGCCSSPDEVNDICKPKIRWETSTVTTSVAIRGRDGKPVQGSVMRVTFDCRCYICVVPDRPMRYHIERCYPPGDATSDGIEESRAAAFLGPDGQWLKLWCRKWHLPYVGTYFAASKACTSEDTSFDIPVENPPSKPKTLKVSFKCNEAKSEISQCFFTDQAPKVGIDVSASGFFGGLSNKRFKLTCSKLNEPTITDELFPEICHSAKKVAEIPVESSKKTKSIRFVCNDEMTRITHCFPPNAKDNEGVPADNKRPVEFTSMMTTFTIKCYPDQEPKLKAIA